MYEVELLDQELDAIIIALELYEDEHVMEQQKVHKLRLKLVHLKRKKDHPDDKQDGG